jgi:hypothetical protein
MQKNKFGTQHQVGAAWPPLSGLLDKFSFCYKIGLSDQCSQPLLHEEKPSLIRDLNPGPLGFKSAMLPTEPWRSWQGISCNFVCLFVCVFYYVSEAKLNCA